MTLHPPEKLEFQGTTLGVRERLLLALAAVPAFASGPQKARLQAWLDSVPRPGAFADGTAAAFGASLAADLQRLTWHASGAAAAMVPHVANFLGEAGVPQSQMDAVRAAGQHVRPTVAGSFIEAVAGAGIDAGWSFPVPLPLARARAHAAAGGGNESLGRWAAAHGVTQATGLGHACGSDCTRIDLALPDLDTGLDAFATLGLPPPPGAAVAALRSTSAGLGLSGWLGPNGLPVKLGLLANQPSTRLVVELCQAVGVQEDAALASFQGLLSVAGASQVEIQWLDGRFGVELHHFAGADAQYQA